MKSHFIGTLDVRLDGDASETWMLLSPLSFYSEKMKVMVTAYPGFRTDFCSVPRIPVIYSILGNRAHKLGVIHDNVYQLKTFPRQQCDELILEMGPLCGLTEVETWEVYVAVRMCGQKHYGETVKDEHKDFANSYDMVLPALWSGMGLLVGNQR